MFSKLFQPQMMVYLYDHDDHQNFCAVVLARSNEHAINMLIEGNPGLSRDGFELVDAYLVTDPAVIWFTYD